MIFVHLFDYYLAWQFLSPLKGNQSLSEDPPLFFIKTVLSGVPASLNQVFARE